VVQELEVLILHVLHLCCRNPLRREQPVEIAGPAPVESELPGRVEHARQQPRLEVDLQVHDQVEPATRDSFPKVPESTQSPRAIEHDVLIDVGMRLDQGVRDRLNDPRDPHPRPRPLERGCERHAVDDVANSAEQHDRDGTRRIWHARHASPGSLSE